jgi:hypothetical protein
MVQPDRDLLKTGPSKHQAGMAAYNYALDIRLLVCCFSSKSPALVAIIDGPREIAGLALPPASPVAPVLSGRDQASPNFLIANPQPAHSCRHPGQYNETVAIAGLLH